MFPEHNDSRIEAVHLIMVGDQEIEKAGSLPERQKVRQKSPVRRKKPH